MANARAAVAVLVVDTDTHTVELLSASLLLRGIAVHTTAAVDCARRAHLHAPILEVASPGLGDFECGRRH